MAISTVGIGDAGVQSGSWVDQIRALGRPLTAVVLIVIVWTVVTGSRNPLKSGPPPVSTIGYVLFMLIFALKLGASGYVEEALLYLAIAFVYWYLFGFLLVSRHIRPTYTTVDAAYAIGLAHVLVVVLNILASMLVIDGDWWSRRAGVLSVNPNTLGYAVAITSFCSPVFFKAFIGGNISRVAAYVFVSAMALVLVLVSGTRGATILLALGLLFGAFIVWEGKWRLVVSLFLFVGIAGVVQWWEFSPIELVFSDRLDTRSHVFLQQWHLFTTSPVFGAPWEDPRVRFGENTYLGALAQLGLVGAVAVYVFLFGAAGIGVARAWRMRGRKGAEVDLALFFSVMAVLVGGTVEALVLGVVGLPIFLVLIVAAAFQATKRGSEGSGYMWVRLSG